MNAYVALDLETTGLSAKADRILEIGAAKVEDGVITETYSTLVDPKMAIPCRITELTGITPDMVQGCPKPSEAVKKLIEFCGELPLLGHNILFDYSFVKHCAVNQGICFEKKGVDTLKISRVVLPKLPSRGLQSLRLYYGIHQEQAHRALDDAVTAHKLFERLRKDFGREHPELFVPKELVYKAKRQSEITPAQKRYLQDLVKYHRIELNVEADSLTKNEASRLIDTILASHGKIKR